MGQVILFCTFFEVPSTQVLWPSFCHQRRVRAPTLFFHSYFLLPFFLFFPHPSTTWVILSHLLGNFLLWAKRVTKLQRKLQYLGQCLRMLRMHWRFCNLVLILPPKFYEIVTSLHTSVSSFLCQHIWSVKAPDTEHQYCRSLWHSLYSLPAPLLSTWLTPNSHPESLYHAHPDLPSKITAHSVSMPSCLEGNPLLFRNNLQIGFS